MDTSRPHGRDSTFSPDDHPHHHRPGSPLLPLRPEGGSHSRDSVSDDDGNDSRPSDDRQPHARYRGPGRLAVEKPSYLPHHLARQRQMNNAVLVDDVPFLPTTSYRDSASSSQDPHPMQLPQRAPPPQYSRMDHVPHGQGDVPSERTRGEYSDEQMAGRPRSVSRDSRSSGRGHTRKESESGSSGDEEEELSVASGAAVTNATSTQPRYQLRRLSGDELFVPHNIPPPYKYGEERYPAYDANARRIGLDHVRYENIPPTQGSNSARTYYRPRTHTYPAPNTSMRDLPHVMTMTLDSNISQSGPSTSASAPVPRSTEFPPRDIDMSPPSPTASSNATQEQEKDPPLASRPPVSSAMHPDLWIASPQDDSSRTDRRVTTGRIPIIPPRDTTDGTPHLREMLGLGPNDSVSLDSLSDPPPGVKPSYPYPVLIQLAINGSARKRLTLSEIYNAIEERFEWFRNTEDKAWQGSIRHTLSLKSCFRTISRPITEPGKGNYWIVDFSMGDGNKRPRKRNPRPKKAERLRMAAEAARQEQEDDETSDDSLAEADERPSTSRRNTHDDDDDPNIDPQLRGHGHMVGEGRPRISTGPAARRSARRGHSPYSAPSPASQSNRSTRSYGSSSSVPIMTPVTSWGSARPSSSTSNHSTYDTSYSSTRSTLHPSRDNTPRPGPSTSKAAPSNWAPYGSYPAMSTSSVPSISSTARQSPSYAAHNPHSPTLTSLSGSTRPYVTTQSYTSNTRTTSSHEYEYRYDRRDYTTSRSAEPRDTNEPPPRRTTRLNTSPDWESSAVPRRGSYDYSSGSSDSSEE